MKERKEERKKRERKASRQARKIRRKENKEGRRQGREGGRKKIRNLVCSCYFIEMSRGRLIPKVLKMSLLPLNELQEIPKKPRALNLHIGFLDYGTQ